jgi:hypothetical protein
VIDKFSNNKAVGVGFKLADIIEKLMGDKFTLMIKLLLSGLVYIFLLVCLGYFKILFMVEDE